MYSDLFTRIYNEFGWNYYPEALAPSLLRWICQNRPRTRRVLDLGCGTGVLCRILRQNGLDAWGADLSPDMVAIAKEADPQGHYETADMTSYRPSAVFDLVTCTGDAVNHLTDPADVEKTFRNVYGYLAEGGVFIFDLLSEKEIADTDPIDYPYSEDISGRFRMTRGAGGLVELKIEVFEKGVKTLEEVIRERLYEPGTVCAMLERAGFTGIRTAHRLLEEDGEAVTWYVIAEK